MQTNNPSQRLVSTQLSIMMFLQFFVWGAWFATAGQYMAAHGMAGWIGWAYTVGPIAALVSPFFLGIVADRFFATERVLGVIHILGGIVLFFAPMAAQASPKLFIVVLLLHMLCYMPTLGLTNTLSFHNMTNPEKQFPFIRVFGTIGWIAAGLVVSTWLKADKMVLPFQIGAAAAILLGLFSFTLPHTPAPAAGKTIKVREILGLDSLALMKQWPFAVFVVASMLICIPLGAYFAFGQNFIDHAGFHAPAGTLTIGQMSEIIFMLLMPLFFVRLGVKYMLVVGMLAWVVRYALFAAAAPQGVAWMILGGIALHGICYDFFFVTGFIYTDKKAPREIRGQAQGFLVLVTQGLGLGLGAQIMQRIVNHFTPANSAALAEQASALRKQYEALMAQGLTEKASAVWQQSNELLLKSVNWQPIWLVTCAAAAVVMVLFFVLFKDDFRTAQTPTEKAEAARTQA